MLTTNSYDLIAAYGKYVDTFRLQDGTLPPMKELKRVHTAHVFANASLIAEGEHFDDKTRRVSLTAALLHDAGRYEQLRRYKTFRDSDSVDHAVLSHDIVMEQGWLDRGAFPVDEQKSILAAILYHNRRELPEGLDRLTFIASHTVRDADKLDIFRVLENQIKTTDWHTASQAFWNLSTTAAPNPVVVKAIIEKKPVDYQNIQSLADFVLIQVGWMVSGLHFATSRQTCRMRNHLKFRQDFLHELTNDPSIDQLCALAERALRS